MDPTQLQGTTANRLFQLAMEPTVTESESEEKDYYFSVASENPVRMMWGDEVLSHDPEAIDLSRAKNMAVVWDHGLDPTVGTRPIGKVEQWDIRGKKSYCRMRWANTAIAQELRGLVDDGTISNVSIRYEIQSAQQRGDQVVVDRWAPVHISFVSDPADNTVGIGRAYKSTMASTVQDVPEGIMATTETKEIREPEPVNVQINERELRQAETERVRGIMTLCNKHGLSDLGDRLIEEGASITEARAKVLEHIERGHQSQPLGGGDPTLAGFSQKEDKQYSLLNAIRSICPGFPEYQKNCFEREVSEEIGRKVGKTTAGVFVPVRHLTVDNRRWSQRDILQVGNAALGGNLVATDLRSQDFIEALRNQAIVFQLGAKFLTGLQGFVDIPKQTGVSSTYWIGENQTIPESALSFGHVSMSPKHVVSRVTMTRQLLQQSSLSAENLVREDMVKQIALAVDKAAIHGSGVGPEPRGVLNYAINSLTAGLGNDGTAPSYENIVKLAGTIWADNADISTMNWLTNSKVKAKLMLTPMQSSGIEGNFVMKEGASSLLGYGVGVSNQVPSNLTKGNGTGLSALILGCWDQLLVGEWGVLEILPNVYGKTYETGGVEIRAIKTLDLALRHEDSFAALTDVITV